MRNFREHDVWKRAHALTMQIYRTSRDFPVDERYGLVSQIRRASSSIGLNIAEGAGKNTDKEFAHGLVHAMGSLCELEYAILLCKDLGYVSSKNYLAFDSEIQSLKRMLYRLHGRLRKSSP